jgi:hypothetical protein
MSDKGFRIAAAILGVLMAAGIAGAGYFVSTTLYKGRLAANAVTVRGFAERDVKADLALWRIGFAITGGNLPDAYRRSQANAAALTGFLAQRGFKPDEISPADLRVTDQMANAYRPKDLTPGERYVLNTTISVRTADVARVDASLHALNDLIRQGIVLTANDADYEFTGLNDIKAPMLRDATRNARDAAQQFANDADSQVGAIQSASQGFFSIVSRDAGADDSGYGRDGGGQSTIDKRVRVVVTLTYYLER